MTRDIPDYTSLSQGEQPNTQEKGQTVEVGVSGLNVTGGYVLDDYLPELNGERGRRKYREMQLGDPIVGALLSAIEMMVRSVDFRFEPSEADIENKYVDFMSDQFEDMEFSWDDTLSEILTMLPYGFSIMEMVFKTCEETGLIKTAKLAPRDQSSLWEWDISENGEVKGIVQWPPYGGNRVYIPYERVCHFRTKLNRTNPEGRALCPDTDIPTPDGWKKMDDLKVGDKIFDEEGKIRYVTARADWENRPVYEITFSNGSVIVADENHEWVTQTKSERGNSNRNGQGFLCKKRNTKEIYGTQKVDIKHNNHSIPWAGALDYSEQLLPLDPYILGLWLGDGHSLSAMITSHVDDVYEVQKEVESRGCKTAVKHNGHKDGNGKLLHFYGKKHHDPTGPAAALRLFNLHNNKHIPEPYLRGSVEQRMDLLSGLMDSDGTVDNSGRCEFTNTNKNLAYGVAELVQSLGIGVTISTKEPPKGHTRECGRTIKGRKLSYRVKFTPTWMPFKLKRKADRCRTERQRMHHFITDVRLLENKQRTVCIEVDSPSHMFLAGRGLIPTHNSILRNAYKSYYFIKNIEMIEAIAIERELAGLPVMYIPAAALQNTTIRNKYEQIVRDVKKNSQGGLVMPSDPFKDENGNPTSQQQYRLELLSASGSRAIDTDTVIKRHQANMARTVLADFIMLGTDGVGSYALSKDKTQLFLKSLEGYIGNICAELNRKWVSTLWDLNQFDKHMRPSLTHGRIAPVDLGELGTFLRDTGINAAFDETVEDYLRDVSGIPKRDDSAAIE